MKTEKIYLAGGCFWGAQKYFDCLTGVLETRVGYANGRTENPTYEQVKYQHTGHAETVEVTFDPAVLSLTELPSPEYPNGYSVRETLTFADAGEFEENMRRLFRTWARAELPEDRPLYFNAACRIAEKEDAVEFWGDGVGCSLMKDEDFLRAVRLVREAPVTFEELCRTLLAQDRRALLLWQKLQYLYERGYMRWA